MTSLMKVSHVYATTVRDPSLLSVQKVALTYKGEHIQVKKIVEADVEVVAKPEDRVYSVIGKNRSFDVRGGVMLEVDND